MTCQNAADESDTGLRCARLCRPTILRWDNFTLRTSSSPWRTRRLRRDGLSPFGIRDTGQNTSPVQNALRSLHYVAVTTCRPQLAPPQYHFPCLIFGAKTPCRVGPSPKKCAENSLLFRDYYQLSLKWPKLRIQCGTFLSLSCFA